MVNTNFDLFDGDAEEAVEYIENLFQSFVDYANVVISEQVHLPMWTALYGRDSEKYQFHVTKIDETRHFKHEAAIRSINQLNRLYASFGLKPFADINTEDRYIVADFVGDFVMEVYNEGIKKPALKKSYGTGQLFDEATYGKEKEYDRNVIKEKLEEELERA